jgi:hypothetical protein
MAVYIRNRNGGIQSVEEDFLEDRIKEDAEGRVGPAFPGPKYLPHGWTEITEEEAREELPILFGAHDERVQHNSRELKEMVEREEFLAKYTAQTNPAAPVSEELPGDEAPPADTDAKKAK